ncbi:MAG TPA: membrane protein insertion efficiency factor YidD [Candidatus Omnitrophica bacterium]|nr:membrane protein insertion efficiency factor YidD [Candidatus Omnitrophota bacterium]
MKLFFVYSIIQPIRLYQRIVSLRLAPSCRFYPSCSHYFIQAISHFGLFKGSCRGFFRILRCNPLSLGGYDPVTGDKNNE